MTLYPHQCPSTLTRTESVSTEYKLQNTNTFLATVVIMASNSINFNFFGEDFILLNRWSLDCQQQSSVLFSRKIARVLILAEEGISGGI